MLAEAKRLVPKSIRRSLKINRARVFERLGSARYSRPALDRLDEKVLAFLPSTPGVFVELGANDGYSYSNTYFLERMCGWRGVLIEPLPALHKICQRVRPRSQCFNLACVADDRTTSVTIADADVMSVTLGQQDPEQERRRILGFARFAVPASTLSAILDQANEPNIDFASVDVEGAELAVLDGLDLTRHTPSILLVETAVPDEVAARLEGWMVPVTQLSHHDYLFKKRSL